MSKRKFVHIAYSHAPDDVRILKKECKSLVNFPNAEVIYITSDRNCNSLEYNTEHEVQVIIVPIRGKRIIRFIRYLKDIKTILLELDADIYHIHEPWLLPLVNLLKRRKKKVVFDSHEFYYDQFKSRQGFISNLFATVYSKYEDCICKKIDAVIFPCTKMGKNVFEGRCKRSVQIDNYVILNENIIPHEFLIDSFNPILCYAGTISESRGLTNTIRAAYRANTKLLLAGSFSSESYKMKLKRMKEFNCVEFFGVCTSKEVDAIYNNSTVGTALLLPEGQYYIVDNMSTKVYEYMQKKMPVIISSSPFVQSVMKDYKFGICVDPENIDEIVEAINFLKNNPAEAKMMGEEGRKAVLEKYNWNKEEKKLFNLYGELLAEKNEQY